MELHTWKNVYRANPTKGAEMTLRQQVQTLALDVFVVMPKTDPRENAYFWRPDLYTTPYYCFSTQESARRAKDLLLKLSDTPYYIRIVETVVASIHLLLRINDPIDLCVRTDK